MQKRRFFGEKRRFVELFQKNYTFTVENFIFLGKIETFII